MKKKIVNRVVITLALVAVLCTVTGSAFATGADDLLASAGMVSPRYATIKKFHAELAISSSSQASCQVEVSLYGSYRGEITVYLQNQSSGWQTVKSWSGTGNRCNGSYYVPEGDSYRVKGDLRVYDNAGNLVETATVYSDVISY